MHSQKLQIIRSYMELSKKGILINAFLKLNQIISLLSGCVIQ